MINVIAAHRPPLVFVEGDANATSSDVEPLYTGYLVDLLPTLLQKACIQDVS